VVLLTDGRANVSLAKSNEDPEALAEGAPKLSKVGPLLTPCFGQDCLQIRPVIWYMPWQAMQCSHKGVCVTLVTQMIVMQHFKTLFVRLESLELLLQKCLSCACKVKLAYWTEQHAVEVKVCSSFNANSLASSS